MLVVFSLLWESENGLDSIWECNRDLFRLYVWVVVLLVSWFSNLRIIWTEIAGCGKKNRTCLSFSFWSGSSSLFGSVILTNNCCVFPRPTWRRRSWVGMSSTERHTWQLYWPHWPLQTPSRHSGQPRLRGLSCSWRFWRVALGVQSSSPKLLLPSAFCWTSGHCSSASL